MSRGRHRQQRRSHAVARRTGTAAGTVAAVAGVATAGVLASQPADASTPNVWDRVAACESSGRWHVNTHNHYYGGLQFGPATWADFGGLRYAPRANVAHRRQQIAVARRVLAAQGPHAWPVCGKEAHLTRRNGGATTAPLPTGPGYRRVNVPRAHRPEHSRPAKPRVSRYQVRSGDSLSTIAERFHVAGGWHALWRYNHVNVPHPNVIIVGQILQIP